MLSGGTGPAQQLIVHLFDPLGCFTFVMGFLDKFLGSSNQPVPPTTGAPAPGQPLPFDPTERVPAETLEFQLGMQNLVTLDLNAVHGIRYLLPRRTPYGQGLVISGQGRELQFVVDPSGIVEFTPEKGLLRVPEQVLIDLWSALQPMPGEFRAPSMGNVVWRVVPTRGAATQPPQAPPAPQAQPVPGQQFPSPQAPQPPNQQASQPFPPQAPQQPPRTGSTVAPPPNPWAPKPEQAATQAATMGAEPELAAAANVGAASASEAPTGPTGPTPDPVLAAAAGIGAGLAGQGEVPDTGDPQPQPESPLPPAEPAEPAAQDHAPADPALVAAAGIGAGSAVVNRDQQPTESPATAPADAPADVPAEPDPAPAQPAVDGDDEGAGWNAITAVCEAAHPGQSSFSVRTRIPYVMGGNDPLSLVSVYRETSGEPHWHYVGYGLSDVHLRNRSDDPQATSGRGYELTYRLADPGAADQSAQPPIWPVAELQFLARYVLGSGNDFAVGDHMRLGRPITNDAPTGLTGLGFIADPQLTETRTPSGTVRFVQVVGIAEDEVDAMANWSGSKFLGLLTSRIPLGVTRLDRPSLLTDPQLRAAYDEGLRRDGSNTGTIFASALHWQPVGPGQTMINIDADAVSSLNSLLPLRLPFGRRFALEHTVNGQHFLLGFQASDQPQIQVNQNQLIVNATTQMVDELGRGLPPQPGDYVLPSFPGLVWRVLPKQG